VLAQLVRPDAGTLDGSLSARAAALAQALAWIDPLATAADAPVLRAQRMVLHAMASAQLDDARPARDRCCVELSSADAGNGDVGW
jgi:hypothetical protein